VLGSVVAWENGIVETEVRVALRVALKEVLRTILVALMEGVFLEAPRAPLVGLVVVETQHV